MNYIVTKKQLRVLTENINSNIFESTLDDQDKNELYQYGITYLGGPDEKNCEKLIQDGESLEKAVEEGKLKMEPEDIKEFKTNLNKLKTANAVGACRMIKPTIIRKFKEGFESNYQKAKISLCWFAKNINDKELNACKVVSTQNQQAPQQSVQSTQIQLPQTVSGSFTSSNGDDAHNFAELEKKLEKLLPEIYAQKINPKMTAVTAKITKNGDNNFTTTYSVTVDKSDDGKAWMGFTARGSYGGDYLRRANGQIDGTENQDGKSLKEKLSSIGAGEIIDIAGSPVEDKTVPFKEYFVQFTKPQKYPPHKQVSNTEVKPTVPDSTTVKPTVPDSTTVKPTTSDSTTVKSTAPDSTTVKSTAPVSNSTAPIVKRVVRRF